jgi:hypothetical protein
MALANGLRFIWLDTHIGVMGQYQALKEQFRSNLRPVMAVPPESVNDQSNLPPVAATPLFNINELICYFEEHVAPIEFVSETEDALALIRRQSDKRIKFISSGILGEPIIPKIISEYPYVDYFYIFCGYVRRLTEWALEHGYEECMKILDHEKDLLLHLVRDASNDIIKLGKTYMDLSDGKSALECFETAQNLETLANAADPGRAPLRINLNLLNGDNGLIAKARNLKKNTD